MNLNANQLKVLAYVRPYLGKPFPCGWKAEREIDIKYSTYESALIALERGGMIQRTKGKGRVLLYCADVPKVKASTNTPEAARLSWQKARERALAEGTRR